MARERHTCWDHFGFEQDVTVYSVGGSNHYVEVRSITDGRLVLKKTFGGRDARKRAIEFASSYDEALGPQDPAKEMNCEFARMVEDGENGKKTSSK